MQDRQSRIFITLVREYIKSGAPISSHQILMASGLDVSSATVRNDMVSLEESGLIIQPHTSSGRIPTEEGFRLYVRDYITERVLQKKYIKSLQEFLANENTEYTMKFLAKGLAEISGLLVFVAFGRYESYYTGLSRLLGQPEFAQYDRVHDISKVVDQLDDVISKIFGTVTDEVSVFIGMESPFSPDTGVVMSNYEHAGSMGILGILGPLRMDYESSIALIKYVREVAKVRF